MLPTRLSRSSPREREVQCEDWGRAAQEELPPHDPAVCSQKQFATVGFGSHRNSWNHANATLVSTVGSAAAVVSAMELYLAGSSVWPTRGRLVLPASLALHRRRWGLGR